MNNTQEITLDKHFRFVKSLKTNTSKAAYLAKSEDKGIGIVQLNKIEGDTVKDVGMYVYPAMLKRGAGYRLGFYGAWFLFEQLGFETLYFQANRNNFGVLRLWEVLGMKSEDGANTFEVKGTLKRSNFMVRPRDFKAFMKTPPPHESI